MTGSAITIEGLYFSYGKKHVLKGVDLEVPKGSIFGFLGRNGAGKTTTIKTLLGLQKPHAGRCVVGGLDSVTETLKVRKKIGFMAEDQQMYGWMTVNRIIKWVAGFYPNWDQSFVDELGEIRDGYAGNADSPLIDRGLVGDAFGNSHGRLKDSVGQGTCVVLFPSKFVGLFHLR